MTPIAAASSTPLVDPRKLLPPATLRQLDNGLTVCALENRRSPVVATALVYRAGTRDERASEGGCAHFLEHMMFKGSKNFGPGEIDRLTRALGGSNNAYTSHDSTLYYFTFAADRWRQALAIEADRMAGLALEAKAVESERRVIVEEIAMYEAEPWDALEQKVASALFAGHSYGRPVLGTRESLAGLDGAVLAGFHGRRYRPDNAVLAVVGDFGDGVLDDVAEAFAGVPRDGALDDPSRAGDGPVPLTEVVRVERRHGETSRMLLSWRGPAAQDPDHPLVEILMAILATGRASRLHRALVDEGQLCTWVTADLQETLDPGAALVALELLAGVEPARVEAQVFEEIDRLRREGPSQEELVRAQRILVADWVFGNERVYQQAFLAATSVALFDGEHPWRYFDRLMAATCEEVHEAARRWLRPRQGAVLGWSLPRSSEGTGNREGEAG